MNTELEIDRNKHPVFGLCLPDWTVLSATLVTVDFVLHTPQKITEKFLMENYC